MDRVVRSIARLSPRFVLLTLVCSGFGAPANRPVVCTTHKAGPVVAHAYYPEVRLRKLHLVRPDLIPYPIEYEVYC